MTNPILPEAPSRPLHAAEATSSDQRPAPDAARRPGPAALTHPADTPVVGSPSARRVLAVVRVALGLVFLWPFVDKTFGLGYRTPSERAWIQGGTPTEGYLRSGSLQGPFADFFTGIAGPATDWLFMLGLLGTGVALTLGIGLRVAAVVAVLIMGSLWAITWPLQQGSDNPLVDSHILHALTAVALAVTAAGTTWGLGSWWAGLPAVRRAPWLR